jgi:SAM-dependent methyltransferase
VGCQQRFEAGDWICPRCGFRPDESGGVPVFAPALADGDGSDAEYRFDGLAAAQSWHFWFVRRALLLSWAVRTYFPRAETLLEVGCGTGAVAVALSEALPAVRITAVDTRTEGLAHIRNRTLRVEAIQCDGTRLPFDAEFDVAGAFDVLEHLDADVEALGAMREALKPGGGVIITVPQHPWLWSEVDDFSHHRRRYTRTELRAKLERSGFNVVRMTSFVAAAVPILMVTRRIPRTFDPERELRISPRANAVMGSLLGLEHRLIAAGVSLPFGTSLLAVARRRA